MAEPFVGEIKIFGFSWAPRNWAKCDGQLLNIGDHTALFSILSDRFGGNGTTTFALPDLRGRTPVHPGNGIMDAMKGGLENVALTTNNLPTHNHNIIASNSNGDNSSPDNNYMAVPHTTNTRISDIYTYSDSNADTTMLQDTLSNTGYGAAHNNMQPYLSVNFCIALLGEYPSRS